MVQAQLRINCINGAKIMRLKGLISMALAGVACIVAPAYADEPLFGFVYTTDTLPKGQSEVEQWVTLREGRQNGDFHLVQARTEFSHGATDNLQLSFYINSAFADVDHNGPPNGAETVAPEVFADFEVDPNRRFKKLRFESMSVEAIYRFLSPYTSGIGAALYIEPSIGPNTRELETRLILQKNFLDDKLVFAANATVGFEVRQLPGDPTADPASAEFNTHWDKETDVNFGLAGAYRFTSNWSFGAELQNEREFAGLNPFKPENRTNLAWYAGPTLHYGGRHFFATFTTLFQLPWAKDYAEPDKSLDAVINGLSNADDFETMRFRLKLGYYF
jgi:hypothetical protein